MAERERGRSGAPVPRRGDPPPFRVGFDVRILQESGAGRGIATYIRGLLHGLDRIGASPSVVRYRYGAPAPRGPLPAEGEWVRLRRAWRETRVLADALNQVLAPMETWRGGVDLVHAPSPYDLAAWYPRPLVVTVHDVAPLVAGAARTRTGLEHRFLYRFVRRARRIVTVSEFSRGEILRHLDVDPRIVRVIPEAPQVDLGDPGDARVAEVRREHGLEGPYLLHVGGYDRFEPRKDVDALLAAFAELSPRRPALKLALAGGGGVAEGPLQERIEELGIAGRVVRTGWVPPHDLGALYRGAAVFVFPSTYEGFGLPLLEAMALGAPCVASRAASLPEVGGEAVLYVEPGDVAGLRDAVEGLLEYPDRAGRLRDAARARARTFRWEETARRTVEVWTEVVRGLAPDDPSPRGPGVRDPGAAGPGPGDAAPEDPDPGSRRLAGSSLRDPGNPGSIPSP